MGLTSNRRFSADGSCASRVGAFFMSEGIPPIVLNANQRRHFEVLFARLEDSLTRIERLLAPDAAPQNHLSIERQDVPDKFREQALPVISELRTRVIQFATALELRPRQSSRARSIAATLSSEAIRVEESLSSQLRGYGEVHPSVPRYLDPALKEIAQLLTKLSSNLEHLSQSTQGR
jgi:hypothetical protein